MIINIGFGTSIGQIITLVLGVRKKTPTLRFSWISEVAIFFSLLCFIIMASMRSHSLDSSTFFVGNIEHLQLLWGQQAFM